MASNTDTKYATVHLPYFKQGDDLRHFLCGGGDQPTANPVHALRAHADMLDAAAAHLRRLAEAIRYTEGVELDADTHHIGITGPVELIDRLVAQELATLDPWDDEEEDEGDADTPGRD